MLLKEIVFPADIIRASKPERLPTVLSHAEALSVINNMSGLRIMECMRLRVKDLDFENHQLIIRDGKGENDRVTILPDSLIPILKAHLETVRIIHQMDLKEGYGEVFLPDALARKFPNAPKEFAWQYVFPASARSVDPVSKRSRRHYLDVSVTQQAIRLAAQLAKIDKPVTPHTFRQCEAYL